MFKDKQTISVKLGNWIEAKASGAFAVSAVFAMVIAMILFVLPSNYWSN